MNINKRLRVFLCLSLLIATNVHAEFLSDSTFKYQGGKLSYLERNDVFSTWNANNASFALQSGMKVMFFGKAEGCNLQASNGPVKNQDNVNFSHAFDLTGIPLAPEGNGQRWTPSANTEQCDKSIHNDVGESFVHINEDSANGGIGLFTFTGTDANGHRSFFRQFDSSGKEGKGFNAGIEGTFVIFRFDWQKANAVHPWGGKSASVDQRIAEFRTVQSVAVVSLGDENLAALGEPIQAKQQFISAFINRACFLATDTKKGMCQLQYLFNTSINRGGISNWDTVKWFKQGGVFGDPGQGGMPVVHGPISPNGETVFDGSGLPLYTSKGEPSQHATFKDKEFRVQVSFAQLKNALKIIAAKTLDESIDDVSDDDLVSLMGAGWNNPNEWLLLSINVSQEVHNLRDDVSAYIGGHIKALEITSVNN